MGLVAALEWLGKPYRLCRVDMLTEMKDPSFARINARHETPAFITDKGAPLTETAAIADWLEARDTERRISFDPLSLGADRMHQLVAFINTGFSGAFLPLWAAFEMDLGRPRPALQAALREWGSERVLERHAKLEQMAGDGPFLVGDRPTLADAMLIGVARWLDFHKVGEPERWPKLAAIRRRLEADPAVIYATALESGEAHQASTACVGHVQLAEVIERYGT
jgi:glutathione S-transferase